MKVVICLLAAVLSISTAFQVPTIPGSRAVSQKECRHHRYPTFLRAEGGDDNADLLFVKSTLETQYPNFYKILSKNDAVWKALANAEGGGFTIFAPNAAAFAALGQNKWDQLLDARNLEQTEKIGAFHVIAETVTAEQLFNSGGILTLAGDEPVPVDRSTSGGMFGMGGKEDGGVIVGGAKVVASVPLAGGVLHETDGFISPSILWRYMDQLRIPGSK